MALSVPKPPPPAERMTRRARAYLSVVSARHLVIGLYCVITPQGFTSSSYEGIADAFSWLPFQAAIVLWGYLFILTALFAAFAAVRGTEGPARTALLLSVFTTACWGGGFLAAIITGVSAGPTGAVIWIAIALKDSTMLRQPLRNPFEGLVQKVMADQHKDRLDAR